MNKTKAVTFLKGLFSVVKYLHDKKIKLIILCNISITSQFFLALENHSVAILKFTVATFSPPRGQKN